MEDCIQENNYLARGSPEERSPSGRDATEKLGKCRLVSGGYLLLQKRGEKSEAVLSFQVLQVGPIIT